MESFEAGSTSRCPLGNRLLCTVTLFCCSWHHETAAARQEIIRTRKALQDIQNNIRRLSAAATADEAAVQAGLEANRYLLQAYTQAESGQKLYCLVPFNIVHGRHAAAPSLRLPSCWTISPARCETNAPVFMRMTPTATRPCDGTQASRRAGAVAYAYSTWHTEACDVPAATSKHSSRATA